MPGSAGSLLRCWGDYIDRVIDHAARRRNQEAYARAVELGRQRDDTVNALSRIAVPVAAGHRRPSEDSDNRQAAITAHAVMDLRDLAAAIYAHADVVLDLAGEVRDSGGAGMRHTIGLSRSFSD